MLSLLKQFVQYCKGTESTHQGKKVVGTSGESYNVAEPILSFVNTVKANPERFTFEGVVNEGYVDPCELVGGRYLREDLIRKFQCSPSKDLFRLTDTDLGISWEVAVPTISEYYKKAIRYPTTQPTLLSCLDETLSFIQVAEWVYIEKELYIPYLQKSLQIMDAQQRRETQNQLRRGRESRAAIQAREDKIREAYKEAYCKEEVK